MSDFMPVPFGVSANTGLPLPEIQSADLALLSASAEQNDGAEQLARFRDGEAPHFGVTGEIRDLNDLRETGWGLIFSGSTDTAGIKAALKPLLEHRDRQVANQDLF